jgi:hypothetical protein
MTRSRLAVYAARPDHRCYLLEDQARSSARDLRRLLASVLLAEVTRVSQSEWWHWSFGDQHRAYQTGAAAALCDEIHERQCCSVLSRDSLGELIGDHPGALQRRRLPLTCETIRRINITQRGTKCGCLSQHVREKIFVTNARLRP